MTTQYEKFLQNGKEIFDTYCSPDDNDKHPIMLPRAPQQKYIDRYPDQDQAGCSFEGDRQHQSDYEAEVKVYRALENLGETLIVLHNFEYTHFQYYSGNSSHDKRGCTKCKKAASKEGECDFVVIGSSYFVIIEVKNTMGSECNKDQLQGRLTKSFVTSLQQRKKMVELIKRFSRRLTVLQFTAYPNLKNMFKEEFQHSGDQKSTIIFEEDLHDFIAWWQDNVIVSRLILDEPLHQEHREAFTITAHDFIAWCQDNIYMNHLILDGPLHQENREAFTRAFTIKAHDFTVGWQDNVNLLILDEPLYQEHREAFTIKAHDFIAWCQDNMNRHILIEPLHQEYREALRIKAHDFIGWWLHNVNRLILDGPLHQEYEEARNFLLAIWCTDNKGKCDLSKCSLGRCILDIDKKLYSGKFTFRQSNPSEVVETPADVKEFLGIDNLTKQQHDLINSTEKLLWINGPAGTGKTVVLVAKMLKLARENEANKIVFINFTGVKPSTYYYQHQEALDKAGIKNKMIVISGNEPVNVISREISSCLLDHQVAIVVLKITLHRRKKIDAIANIINSLQGFNVCVDDIQFVCSYKKSTTPEMDSYCKLFDTLQKLSESHYVYLACDMMQSRITGNDVEDKTYSTYLAKSQELENRLSSGQQVSLTKILRNSFDLSIVLASIRSIISGLFLEKSNLSDIMFPVPMHGHYIHGPKTVIHVLKDFNEHLIKTIFNKEFSRILDITISDDVGFISTGEDKDTLSLVEDLKKDPCHVTRFWQHWELNSKEWPAIIVLHQFNDYLQQRYLDSIPFNCFIDKSGVKYSNIEILYLAMSRARVKCTVIMYPLEGLIFDDVNNKTVRDLLDKLNDHDSVEINEYSLIPQLYTPRSRPEGFVDDEIYDFVNDVDASSYLGPSSPSLPSSLSSSLLSSLSPSLSSDASDDNDGDDVIMMSSNHVIRCHRDDDGITYTHCHPMHRMDNDGDDVIMMSSNHVIRCHRDDDGITYTHTYWYDNDDGDAFVLRCGLLADCWRTVGRLLAQTVRSVGQRCINFVGSTYPSRVSLNRNSGVGRTYQASTSSTKSSSSISPNS